MRSLFGLSLLVIGFVASSSAAAQQLAPQSLPAPPVSDQPIFDGRPAANAPPAAGGASPESPAEQVPFVPVPSAPVPAVDRSEANDSKIDLASAEAFVSQNAPAAPVPAVPAKPDPEARYNALEQKVNDFIKSTTGSSYPTVKILGVFQADAGWFQQDDQSFARYGRIKDGADFRRFRLAAAGSISEVHNYFMQVDFGFFGRPTIQDLWVEQTDLPILGTVRVGQWKQPFSLEVVSSFRYTTFVERSVLFQSFTPFRHLGIGFYNQSESLMSTWAASVFAAGQDQYGGSISTAGGVGTAERFTHLLNYDEASGGRYYTHVGAAHYFSAPNDKLATFRTIPEVFIGSQATPLPGAGPGQQTLPGVNTGTPFFVNTGALPVQDFNVFGSEFLWVSGPLSVQSEAMINFVNRTNNLSSLYFTGA